MALLLPFYAIGVYAGPRGLRGVWPVLLVAGGSFALAQFVTSNYLGYALTDVLASLVSLVLTLGFLRVWRMTPDPQFALGGTTRRPHVSAPAAWHGWVPWLILSAVVIAWIHLKVPAIGEQKVPWPGLHEAVYITTYGKPYAAIWSFQPLATGTAILVAGLLSALAVGLSPAGYLRAVADALRQVRFPALTTVLIVGLAYLMNYAGMTYTLGVGVAAAGLIFPLLSAFLGWLAVFLSGSDTSGNALFGNLQVVAARQLGLDPVLMAATNSSGGVMGKMISPQNISTGAAVTELKGREGEVFARTFKHSIILTVLLGLLVLAQQYLFPGVIPR
jgi:lactate permease